MRLQAEAIVSQTEALRQATEALAAAAQAMVPPALPPEPPTDDNPRYDQLTVEVVKRVLGREDSGVDVGAHAGDILEQMVAVAPDGRHYAFEPIPYLAEELRRRFPDVQVHEVALSDAEGEATFHHVVSNPSYSGLQRRRFDRPHENVMLTTVRTARLDDLLPADHAVRLLKIDVEGGELGVLRGAARTLATHRPVIVFEHGLGAADFYDTRPETLADLLAEHGYRINLLDRWLDGAPPIDRTEFVRQFDDNENYYFIACPSA